MYAGGEEVYVGRWYANFDMFIAAFPRFGSQIQACENPKPGDDDFLNRKVQYLCSRIPVFKRLTTRDGAVSDFVLRAEDGSIEFNLMSDGVLDEIGAYIAGRYDNDLDRVLGMLSFAHAPWVARHQSAGHRFMDLADGLSTIRGFFSGAGGNCAYNSRAFATLASHLPIDGGLLHTYTCGVWRHTVSFVMWDGEPALLDPDIYHFWLKPDGSGLATIEDFKKSLNVLTTAGTGDQGRYYFFDESRMRQLPSMATAGWLKGCYPVGGPQA